MTNIAPPPSFAPRIWHDGRSLYLQLSDNLQVLRFDFSEAGLHKALKLIPKCQNHGVVVVNNGNIADKFMRNYRVASASRDKRLVKATSSPELEKDLAEIVRKMKHE